MKVFVHIGYYKTGSTVLQHFLDTNREPLLTYGICYPTAGRPANDLGPPGARLPQLSVLSLGLLDSVGAHMPNWYLVGRQREPELYDTAEQWRQVREQIKASHCERAVISSEEFVRFGEDSRSHELASFVREQLLDFDVRIVCYMRRPDNYLISWYNQLVKMGVGIKRLRFAVDRFLPTIHVNYMKALEPWIAAFGQERLVIRDFEPVRLRKHGIIADFLELIGGSIDLAELDTEVPPNLSIPNALVELKRLSNQLNPHSDHGRRANQALMFVAKNWELPKNEEVEMLDNRNRYNLCRAFEPIHHRLSEIKGDGLPLFPTLEHSLFNENTLMTDAEAALQYAGVYQLVLSQMH